MFFEKLGFTKERFKMSQYIDPYFLPYFKTRYAISVVIIILGIIFGIVLNARIFAAVIGGMLLAAYTFYVYNETLNGNVQMYEGICVNVDRPKSIKDKMIQKATTERIKLTLQTDNDLFVELYVAPKFDIIEGSSVAFYTKNSAIRQISDDTYKVLNYFHVVVTARNI